jgi:hypothetical protein
MAPVITSKAKHKEIKAAPNKLARMFGYRTQPNQPEVLITQRGNNTRPIRFLPVIIHGLIRL